MATEKKYLDLFHYEIKISEISANLKSSFPCAYFLEDFSRSNEILITFITTVTTYQNRSNEALLHAEIS